MANCSPIIAEKTASDAYAGNKDWEAIDRMFLDAYKIFRSDELVRYVLTMDGKGGIQGKMNFKSWVEFFTGLGDLESNTMEVGDAERVLARIKSVRSSVESMGDKFKNKTAVSELIKKLATLPGDEFKMHGLGDIHEETSIIDAEKEMRQSVMAASITDMVDSFDAIFGKNAGRKATRKMQDIELRENKARSILMQFMDAKDRGENVSDQKINVARSRLSMIMKEKDAFINADGNEAHRLIRDIGMFMDGRIKHESELLARWKNYDGDKIRTIVNMAKEFMDGKVDPETGEVITVGFRQMARQAVSDARENMVLLLKAKYGEEEAKRMADSLVSFTEIDSYYPHKSLSSLYFAINNYSMVRDHVIHGEFTELEATVAGRKRSGHVEFERTADNQNISWNTFNVLSAYGEEVIRYAHGNKVALAMNKFIDGMSSLDVMKSARERGSSDRYYNYLESVRRLMLAYSHDMLDLKVPTLMDETVNTVVAYQAMLKLVSPSTTILNGAEGRLQYHARTGMRRGLKKFMSENARDIEEVMFKANTKFRTESVFAEELTDNTVNMLRETLADSDIRDLRSLNNDKMAIRAAILKRGAARMASIGMKISGWEAVENNNRKNAFKIGVAEALMYLDSAWKGRFLDPKKSIPKYLVDRFGIDKKLASSTDPESRKKAYAQFREKYAIRQGYRMIFQTQFQYNLSQRNILDKNPKTKLFHMFQHYPRSLASVVAWSAHDVKSLFNVGKEYGGIAGGFKSIFRRTSGESINGGYFTNQNMQYLLTIGAMHAITTAVRFKLGWVLGQFASHPLLDIIYDLVGYFRDDLPDDRTNRFWGKGIASEVTGPMYSDVMDVLSLAAIKNGITTGDMPIWLAEMSRVTAGFRPDQKLLDRDHRRGFSSLSDIVRETFLWDASALYPKSASLMTSVIKMDNREMENLARMVGIRRDYDVMKDKKGKKKRTSKEPNI